MKYYNLLVDDKNIFADGQGNSHNPHNPHNPNQEFPQENIQTFSADSSNPLNPSVIISDGGNHQQNLPEVGSIILSNPGTISQLSQSIIQKSGCNDYVEITNIIQTEKCHPPEFQEPFQEPCQPPFQEPCQPPCQPECCQEVKTIGVIDTIVGNIETNTDITIINQPNSISTNAATLWATKIGNININTGTQVVTDSNYNVIVAGFYRADVTTELTNDDPATIIYDTTGCGIKNITASGIEEIFIIKYDMYGRFIWFAKIEASFTVFTIGITVDREDNVIITGSYTDSALNIYSSDSQLASSTPAPVPQPGTEITQSFIVKYSPAGIFQWVSLFVTSYFDEFNCVTQGITTDCNSNIYVTGYYNSNPVIFQNSDGTTGYTLSASSLYNVFVAAYNHLGFALWVTKMGNTVNTVSEQGYNSGLAISYSPDQTVVVAGYFNTNPFLIYNGPDGTTYSGLSLTNINNTNVNIGNDVNFTTDIFIVKYKLNGTAIWATKLSGTMTQFNTSICVDPDSNIIITGTYSENNLLIYNAPSGTIRSCLNLVKSGTVTTYIVKYNPRGTAIWATRISGPLSQISNAIIADYNSNIIVTGYFSASVTVIYNSDGTSSLTLTNVSEISAYTVKYDRCGTALWAVKQENNGITQAIDVTVDRNNCVIIVGTFNQAPINIYNSNGAVGTCMVNLGKYDAYISKYADFVQSLVLQAGCKEKEIGMNESEYKQAHTLVTYPCGTIRNKNNQIIRGFLMTKHNSSIKLNPCSPCSTDWNVNYSNNILFLYP